MKRLKYVIRGDTQYIVIGETVTDVCVVGTFDYADGFPPCRQLKLWWLKKDCDKLIEIDE